MKIAALSAIHGNLAALEAVLEDVAARRADLAVNLGDILSGPLQPAETADLLAAGRGRADWAYALATGRMPARPATIAA